MEREKAPGGEREGPRWRERGPPVERERAPGGGEDPRWRGIGWGADSPTGLSVLNIEFKPPQSLSQEYKRGHGNTGPETTDKQYTSKLWKTLPIGCDRGQCWLAGGVCVCVCVCVCG